MEALSPTMEEGQVVKWLRSEGDGVSHGDVIAEIETDKATMELTARGDGVLRAILVPEGGTAPVGEVIALIADPDEDISELQAAAVSAAAGSGAGRAGGDETNAEGGVAATVEGTAAGDGAAAVNRAAGTESADMAAGPAAVSAASDEAIDGRIKASPVARRLAADSGVQLATVAKTNRAIYLEEGWPYLGVGAQIVSIIMEEAFDDLDAPVLRVTQADVPLPYNKKLEIWAKPGAARAVEACKKVLYV